jgi:hypothetical protein
MGGVNQTATPEDSSIKRSSRQSVRRENPRILVEPPAFQDDRVDDAEFVLLRPESTDERGASAGQGSFYGRPSPEPRAAGRVQPGRFG